jgi:Flp pilus assembly protein TadB
MRDDNVGTAALPAALFAFLRELKAGVSLGEAMSAAGLDESGLLSALQFVFSEGLVVAVGRSRGTALTT